MKIAVLGTSQKENEKRQPLHPEHFAEIAPAMRQHLFFEESYGEPFGISDEKIASQFGGVESRSALLPQSDVIILLKPTVEEAASLKSGATLWGWIHCVQDSAITQIAIDNQLTYMAWEAMNNWNPQGNFQSHIFAANNQIAGYAGVLHALTLRGIEANYGPPQKVVLINTGQVSKGAMRALESFGFTDIHIVSTAPCSSLDAVFQQATFYQLLTEQPEKLQLKHENATFPMSHLLQEADIIINGIFQNPLRPLMFLQPGEESSLKQNSLIIDISCDTAMGFPFARATSFKEPILKLGNIYYYAVDHTPSLLWQSATWQISKVLLPFLETVVSGDQAVKQCPVLSQAIEIDQGRICNKAILQFQKR